MINNGDTRINYGNLIIVAGIIICGLLLSINDAARDRESIANGISEISEKIHTPEYSGISDRSAAYESNTNTISSTNIVIISSICIALISVAILLSFTRGFA
jgi:ABC-type maltose transport system permease subunit